MYEEAWLKCDSCHESRSSCPSSQTIALTQGPVHGIPCVRYAYNVNVLFWFLLVVMMICEKRFSKLENSKVTKQEMNNDGDLRILLHVFFLFAFQCICLFVCIARIIQLHFYFVLLWSHLIRIGLTINPIHVNIYYYPYAFGWWNEFQLEDISSDQIIFIEVFWILPFSDKRKVQRTFFAQQQRHLFTIDVWCIVHA